MSNQLQLDLIAEQMTDALLVAEAYHLLLTAAKISRRYLQAVVDSGECLDMMADNATLSIPRALRAMEQIVRHAEALDTRGASADRVQLTHVE